MDGAEALGKMNQANGQILTGNALLFGGLDKEVAGVAVIGGGEVDLQPPICRP